MTGRLSSDEASSDLIAVCGDWHGDTGWAMARIRDVGRAGVKTLVHVGDLGAPWPGRSGAKYLRKVEASCTRHGVQLWALPGNHEAWSVLSRYWADESHRDRHGRLRPLRLSEHVTVLPRGHRWSHGGLTCAAVGGAPSVDFESRTRGQDWWPEEFLTESETDAIAADDPVDILFTHDAPDRPFATPAVVEVIETNPHGWSDTALEYAALGRARLTQVFLGLRPRLLVHGHYHLADETTIRYGDRDSDSSVRIVSLPANGDAGNLRFLDLDSLDWAHP